MHVPQHVKDRIEERVLEVIGLAEKKFKKDIKFPTIRYDLRGRVAGQANYRDWWIKINPVLLMENLEDMIENTVPHEVAHLVTETCFPQAHQRMFGKRRPHGFEWRQIMIAMGCVPSTTHRYDTTNSTVKKAARAKHWYACKCGSGGEMSLGDKRHRQMQNGYAQYWMRNHKRCGGYTYIGVGTDFAETLQRFRDGGQKLPVAAQTPPTPPVTRVRAATPKHGGLSKADICRNIYVKNRGLSRAELIQRFIAEAGCTKAGASTYYYNCTKQFGK